MDTAGDHLDQEYWRVIDGLLRRYHWRLIKREEFFRRIHTAARENSQATLSYIAFGIYNEVLHRACSGAEGPLRWEQGYKELFLMLCAGVRSKYPQVWEDLAQTAIELTCAQFERCAVPSFFFGFAWGHLQNAVRKEYPHLRRKDTRVDLSLELTVGDTNLTLSETIPSEDDAFFDQLLVAEFRAELLAILTDIERENPKARDQFAAVRLKFLDGEDSETISRILHVSVDNVYVLLHRGKVKLKADQRIVRLWRDMQG